MKLKRLFWPAVLFIGLPITTNCAANKPAPEGGGTEGSNPQPITQKQIPETNKAQLLQDVKGLPPSGEEIIDGIRRFDGWFFKANRITFKANSVLLFTKQAQANRRQFFVIAKEIKLEDADKPGTITWEKGDVLGAPNTAGEAAGGANGGENSPGTPGATGGFGPRGYDGAVAPSIILITLRVPGSGPLVDLTGQDGGQGGQGQQGGRGGKGGTGNSASQTAFGCSRGAGNGSAGGTGGPGGQGGKGGTGGDGGVFTLISTTNDLPSLTQKFRVKDTGGSAGTPGPGGPGGLGGQGGDGGAQQLPWCSGNGSPGPTGNTGSAGPGGVNGDNGKQGDYTVGGITQEQFNQYVWK
jgi:hypothetical protein